jgi:hypothetical protein
MSDWNVLNGRGDRLDRVPFESIVGVNVSGSFSGERLLNQIADRLAAKPAARLFSLWIERLVGGQTCRSPPASCFKPARIQGCVA